MVAELSQPLLPLRSNAAHHEISMTVGSDLITGPIRGGQLRNRRAIPGLQARPYTAVDFGPIPSRSAVRTVDWSCLSVTSPFCRPPYLLVCGARAFRLIRFWLLGLAPVCLFPWPLFAPGLTMRGEGELRRTPAGGNGQSKFVRVGLGSRFISITNLYQRHRVSEAPCSIV